MTYNEDFKDQWVDDLTPHFMNQTFEILDASDTVLGTVTMPSADLFNASSGGVATIQTTFDIPITVTGTAAKFRAYIGATAYQEGTVGTSGADLNLASTSLNNGDTVRINTWTITFPA